MLHKKLFVTGTIATILLATSLFAEGKNCVGGVCIVDLSKLKPTKTFKQERKPFIVLEKPRFVEKEKSDSLNHIDTVAVNSSSNDDLIDKSFTIVVDGEEIVVFPSYVMTEEEKLNYYAEQEAIALNEKLNEEANRDVLIVKQPIEKIEDKIIEKTELPISEYYCEKDTHPVYNKESDSFQCV